MFGNTRGLALLGTTALCLLVASSTEIGDSRLTRWMSAFGSIDQSLRESFGETVNTPAAGVGQRDDAVAEKAESAPNTAEPTSSLDGNTETPGSQSPGGTLTLADRVKALGYDPTNVSEALAAYRGDNLEAGDALAANVSNALVRTALEWVALREVPQKIGVGRLDAFASAHPDWPAKTWLRTQLEARQLGVRDPAVVQAFFANGSPTTPLGKLALARALKAAGRNPESAQIARAVFRESDLTGYAEALVRAEFGSDLTKSDFKYRADRFVYKEKIAPAMRWATLAGPDAVTLVKARATVIAQASSDKAMAAVPEGLRKDPVYLLSEVQRLRRSGKLIEAARLMESAPHDSARLIDGDEWWVERRVLARKLLDAGKTNAAYIMCAMSTPVSTDAKVEAQFHAGWIALRFMRQPSRAAYHFDIAAKLADTPTSIARIAYWQARLVAASDQTDAEAQARSLYQKAAAHGSTYYGQLARQALGMTSDPVRKPPYVAAGDDRTEAIRVIELLYAAGEKNAAYALAQSAASAIEDPGQIGALAKVVGDQQDAHLSLTIGKIAAQRGMPVDTLAFPTIGIPTYDALPNSASPAVVYSVARQESTFIPTAVSKAGAKGLMQMIDATARSTATKAGVPFEPARLLTDATFNAQLGAAHLGELIAEQNGSLILTFAAYNAGGGRVKDWITAYGDPRKPGVDPVDWVERIPFTETRNYVQRVLANVTMYDAIFASQAKAVATRNAREAKL